jgi:hypothetical protein
VHRGTEGHLAQDLNADMVGAGRMMLFNRLHCRFDSAAHQRGFEPVAAPAHSVVLGEAHPPIADVIRQAGVELEVACVKASRP